MIDRLLGFEFSPIFFKRILKDHRKYSGDDCVFHHPASQFLNYMLDNSQDRLKFTYNDFIEKLYLSYLFNLKELSSNSKITSIAQINQIVIEESNRVVEYSVLKHFSQFEGDYKALPVPPRIDTITAWKALMEKTMIPDRYVIDLDLQTAERLYLQMVRLYNKMKSDYPSLDRTFRKSA